MVGVEKQDSLRFIKLLVGGNFTCVDLWNNDRGDLFIRLPLQNKKSFLIVPVVNETIVEFCMNDCSIKDILKQCPTPFVMLQEGDDKHTMYLPDADINLLHADCTYDQLKSLLAV